MLSDFSVQEVDGSPGQKPRERLEIRTYSIQAAKPDRNKCIQSLRRTLNLIRRVSGEGSLALPDEIRRPMKVAETQ